MPVIHVEMWPGRTHDQKLELAKAITEAVVRIARTSAEHTIVIFDDVHIDSSTSSSENFEVMITDVFSGNATLDAEGDSGSVTILDDESGPRRSHGSSSACCRTSAYPAAMPRRGE